MKPSQNNLIEFLLAVIFVGLFAPLAVRTWGGFFFIHGLVTAAGLLFVTYLLLVLVIRRHRSPQNEPRKH
jgi:ABC-type Fe3+-siderophore transport system permease subunit